MSELTNENKLFMCINCEAKSTCSYDSLPNCKSIKAVKQLLTAERKRITEGITENDIRGVIYKVYSKAKDDCLHCKEKCDGETCDDDGFKCCLSIDSLLINYSHEILTLIKGVIEK
jgi:hypothetical protein